MDPSLPMEPRLRTYPSRLRIEMVPIQKRKPKVSTVTSIDTIDALYKTSLTHSLFLFFCTVSNGSNAIASSDKDINRNVTKSAKKTNGLNATNMNGSKVSTSKVSKSRSHGTLLPLDSYVTLPIRKHSISHVFTHTSNHISI